MKYNYDLNIFFFAYYRYRYRYLNATVFNDVSKAFIKKIHFFRAK